ncbi:MAG: hypothetical protein KGI70_01700 [Patescibacteria group bacterium]|nr:hypothetical protein [Patescibacteria group bacterium]
MNAFLDAVLANPWHDIELIFTGLGVFAFIIFFGGFTAGLPHLFTQNYHAERIAKHRLRVTWGVMMLLALFIVWEVVRWVAGYFS